MSDSDDENIDADHGVTVVISPDLMQRKGLLIANFDEERQDRAPKSNAQRFLDRHGSTPIQLCVIWEDLQTTTLESARVPPEKLKIYYFFLAHHFLRHYQTESERHATNPVRAQTQRDWVWYFVEKIAMLRYQKIVWTPRHIEGDDIWVCTVDGTMSAANEKASQEEDIVKDPKMFSFKHHSSGFNAEVVVSLFESRCLWINSGGNAGENGDRTLFRKPDGLREWLQSIKKKAIADAGYTGDPNEVSTPNGHDEPAVRKFKARALKRHEKFNNMLKVFDCLKVRFRHGEERWKVCFEAVATICQHHLENGQPLFNIYVGDM